MSDLEDGVPTQMSGAERYGADVSVFSRWSRWLLQRPVSDVGQMAGVQEKNRDAGRGGGLGREEDSLT